MQKHLLSTYFKLDARLETKLGLDVPETWANSKINCFKTWLNYNN